MASTHSSALEAVEYRRDGPGLLAMITEEFSTRRFQVQSFNDGLAFILVDRETGNERLLTHSAAFLFGRDLDFLRLQSRLMDRKALARCGSGEFDDMVRRYWKMVGA